MRFKDEDFNKPLVTVAAIYSNALPCNGSILCVVVLIASDHLKELGEETTRQVEAAGGKAIVFGTPVVSDAMTMGMEVRHPLALLTIYQGHEVFTAQPRYYC